MSRPMIFGAPTESPLDGDWTIADGAATLEIAVSAANVQAAVGTNAAAGNQLVFTTLANIDKDHDHAAVASPTLYVQSATDPDVNNTQWVSLLHNATDGILATGSGDVVLDPASAITYLTSKTATSAIVQVRGSTNPQIRIGEVAGPGLILSHSAGFDQFMFALAPLGGNQLVITSWVNFTLDHGHAEATNPTLFVHSNTATMTQWGSLAHDQADFVIASGLGDINLSPASGFLRQVRRVLVSTVPFNASGGTILVGTTQAGDVVTGAWAVVDTAWDGNGTVDLGDAADPDGYLTDATLAKGVLGYKGHEHDTRGALLWDAIGVHDRDKVFTAAGEIRATVVQGTSTFGTMRVFVEVVRLLA